ncbi:hypothetical protein ACFVFS_20825 [Kitasatospora sp. NPDC057692]|uniref:hypothetical protein n=1 Tax=Kitasatospora sp. NPDC057692 TaxID=3346215 RepID=UPI00367B4AAE
MAGDVHSLCCVLYLLCSGRPPHDGRTEGALRDQHLREQRLRGVLWSRRTWLR